jgi:hypothetical protein
VIPRTAEKLVHAPAQLHLKAIVLAEFQLSAKFLDPITVVRGICIGRFTFFHGDTSRSLGYPPVRCSGGAFMHLSKSTWNSGQA